jgi:hypothetical protein
MMSVICDCDSISIFGWDLLVEGKLVGSRHGTLIQAHLY